MTIRLLLACLLLLPGLAFAADTGPRTTKLTPSNITVMIFCDALASAAACTRAGNNIVGGDYKRLYWYFESVRSTATTYSCDAFTAIGGFSASQRTQISELTLANGVTSTGKFVRLPMAPFWWECSTVTGGTVTIHAISTIGEG